MSGLRGVAHALVPSHFFAIFHISSFLRLQARLLHTQQVSGRSAYKGFLPLAGLCPVVVLVFPPLSPGHVSWSWAMTSKNPKKYMFGPGVPTHLVLFEVAWYTARLPLL